MPAPPLDSRTIRCGASRRCSSSTASPASVAATISIAASAISRNGCATVVSGAQAYRATETPSHPTMRVSSGHLVSCRTRNRYLSLEEDAVAAPQPERRQQDGRLGLSPFRGLAQGRCPCSSLSEPGIKARVDRWGAKRTASLGLPRRPERTAGEEAGHFTRSYRRTPAFQPFRIFRSLCFAGSWRASFQRLHFSAGSDCRSYSSP